MKAKANPNHLFGVPRAQLGWVPQGWQLCLSCSLVSALLVLVTPWSHADIGTGVTPIH